MSVLLLLFGLNTDRYAIDARQVVEVLPLLRITRVPQAPQGVAGMFNYRGAPVPVIDLAALTLGRPSHASLSTRLIVVRYDDEHGDTHLLGVIAEQATETMRRPCTDFVDSGVTLNEAPYLGPVTTDARGIIQLVEVSRLVPPPVRDVLFKQLAGH